MKKVLLAAMLFFLALSTSAFADPRDIPMDRIPSRQGERLILGQPTDGSRVAEIYVWHKDRSKRSIYTDISQAVCPEGDWFNFKDERGFWQWIDEDSPVGPGLSIKPDTGKGHAYWCVSGVELQLDKKAERR